jgi:glyoxylase-like metal-dependent hydrolase (beta-lactamase superfamily II)
MAQQPQEIPFEVIEHRGYRIFLLWQGSRATLIDTGCGGAFEKIHLQLLLRGAKWQAIENILVTHAHSLANANLERVRRASGARIHVHRLEASRLAGKFSSSERAHPGFRLEEMLARRFGMKPLKPDIYLQNQDVVECWNCLRLVHLPGHTAGHCGFYSRFYRVLFCGDLFAHNAEYLRRLQPKWIHHDEEEAKKSSATAKGWPRTDKLIPSRGAV